MQCLQSRVRFMPDGGVLQVRTRPTTDSPTYCTTGWTTGWKVLHP